MNGMDEMDKLAFLILTVGLSKTDENAVLATANGRCSERQRKTATRIFKQRADHFVAAMDICFGEDWRIVAANWGILFVSEDELIAAHREN